MTNASHTALAFLLGQHNAEQAALEEIARLKEENAKLALEKSKTAKPRAAKRSRPIHEQGNPSPMNTIHGIALPDKGTLDAAGFMAAMKDAGKRVVHMMTEVVNGKTRHYAVPSATETSHPVTRVVEGEVRNDMIKAIAAFVGYDNRRNFGEQEQEARAMATRLLSAKPLAGPSREEQRQADLSARGFVAGLPDAVASKLADLQGREIIAADAMIKHQKEATMSQVEGRACQGAEGKELSLGLSLVEKERLASIREDIKRLTF